MKQKNHKIKYNGTLEEIL